MLQTVNDTEKNSCRTIQFLKAVFINYAVIVIVVIEGGEKEYSTSHKSDKGNNRRMQLIILYNLRKENY